MSGQSQSSSSSRATSTSLLARVRQRDQVAWRQLAELYSPLVYDWCRKAHLQQADAADVVQEVFRGVLAGIGTFDPGREGASFRAWLRTITRNRLIDLARRREKQSLAPGGSTNQQIVAQIPADLAEETAEEPAHGLRQIGPVQDALLRLRGEIEDRTWQAFWRTTIEDQTAADVAGELGMSLSAVYQAKSRVLSRLRALLSS